MTDNFDTCGVLRISQQLGMVFSSIFVLLIMDAVCRFGEHSNEDGIVPDSLGLFAISMIFNSSNIHDGNEPVKFVLLEICKTSNDVQLHNEWGICPFIIVCCQ